MNVQLDREKMEVKINLIELNSKWFDVTDAFPKRPYLVFFYFMHAVTHSNHARTTAQVRRAPYIYSRWPKLMFLSKKKLMLFSVCRLCAARCIMRRNVLKWTLLDRLLDIAGGGRDINKNLERSWNRYQEFKILGLEDTRAASKAWFHPNIFVAITNISIVLDPSRLVFDGYG